MRTILLVFYNGDQLDHEVPDSAVLPGRLFFGNRPEGDVIGGITVGAPDENDREFWQDNERPGEYREVARLR